VCTSNDIVAKNWARGLTLFLTKGLPYFFEFLGAIFCFLPDILADKNGGFSLGGQHNAVAGTGIDLDDLGMNFVVHLEDDTGKIGVAAQGIDHDAFHLHIQGIEYKADQLVGQGPFVMLPAHGHGDGATDTRLDMNDKAFFLITNKYGQSMLVRGENAKNLHAHDIRVHNKEVPPLDMNDNVGTAEAQFLIRLEGKHELVRERVKAAN
jgi:hypothetical protein